MKIEFLTQEDSLYILPFFEEFLSNYAGQFEITRISCCRAMGKRSRWQLLRELMWLYGTFGLIKLVAQAGVAKIACRLAPNSRTQEVLFHRSAGEGVWYSVRGCGQSERC